jgi:hypothetical protein
MRYQTLEYEKNIHSKIPDITQPAKMFKKQAAMQKAALLFI